MTIKPLTLFSVLGIITLPAVAGQVDVPNTFVAGSKAVASEVNANFDAVKDAVDDNDARLTSVEQTKQNLITGSCNAGQAISAVHLDGTVICETIQSEGYASVSGASFSVRDENLCNAYRTSQGIAYTTSSGCSGPGSWFYSSIQLPHGATITEFQCTFGVGNPDYAFTRASLRRLEFTGPYVPLFEWEGETVSGIQTVESSQSTATPNVVNNQGGAYTIYVANNYDGTNAWLGGILLGCTVGYRY